MPRNATLKHGLTRWAGWLGGHYIRLVHASSRVLDQTEQIQATAKLSHPCIFVFWHGQFLLIPAVKPAGITVANMVARHGDAELISEALKTFDMPLIRGAGAGSRRKDKGGTKALREAITALQNGTSIAMTADIPPGPARKAGLGSVKLAQLSGRPIVPVSVASSRFLALRTWSRMTVNLPFSKIGLVVGAPITVPKTADANTLEQARLEVENALNAATAEAYTKIGADLTAATPHTALPPDAKPEAGGLKLAIYRAATRIGAATAPLVLRHRLKQGKEDRARSSERLGLASVDRPAGLLAWVHAASVGETNAILPLLERLRPHRPDIRFLLTTGTVTSAKLAAERLSPQDIHQYAPWDAPHFVTRFLDHWRPSLAVLTESEIWPNTIVECHTRGIPIAVVNGRMSDRSYWRWRRNKALSHALFGRLRIVLAQTEQLERRFVELGARQALAVGNLKVDSPKLPVDLDKLDALKAATQSRPLWLAASTHEGEEEIALDVHGRLSAGRPDLLTIIAPRHPDRGDAITALAQAGGYTVAQRSKGALPSATTDIYVADTIGELGILYSLTPIAFIGGSLVQKGGQNPIEAVHFDTSIITGPNCSNFQEASRALVAHHGVLKVESADALGKAVDLLMRDEVEQARLAKGAAVALDSLTGALDRTTEELLALLPRDDDQGLQRAS